MTLTRRTLIGGAATAGLVGGRPALAATRAARRFTILRDGSDIGRHVVELTRDGEDVLAAIDVTIVVRILGIAAYRYEMRNRERWRGGRLQSIESDVNDDGRRKSVRVSLAGQGLEVASDFFNGPAPGDAATTTYFTPVFLDRPTWISTDSGEVYAMRCTPDGEARIPSGGGEVQTRRWRATNGSDFDVRLFYDDRGEWASVHFDASGQPATYVADDLNDRLAAVWAG